MRYSKPTNVFNNPFLPNIATHAYVLSKKFIHIGKINNNINVPLLLTLTLDIKYATGYPTIKQINVEPPAKIIDLKNTLK